MCRDVIGAEVMFRQSCWPTWLSLTESDAPWASWPERHSHSSSNCWHFGLSQMIFSVHVFFPVLLLLSALAQNSCPLMPGLMCTSHFPQLRLLAQANTCSGFVLFTQLELACSLDWLQNRTRYKTGKCIATLLFCTTSEHAFIYSFFLSQVTPSLFCKPWRFPRHICHKPSLLLQAWAVQPW